MPIFGFLIFFLALLFPVFGFAATPSQYGLQEGDLISASGDPDIYIINEYGFKRLFLNPAIFGFYGHLGGWGNVKEVSAQTRDAFPTSLYFKNCEIGDSKVYAVEVTGEDESTLHWLNASSAKIEGEDSNFSKKIFCINDREFRWYSISGDYSSTSQVSDYKRGIPSAVAQTSSKEKKLVRLADDPKIYYLTESGLKKYIISSEVFNSYKGNRWEDVVVIDKNELNSYPTANLFRRAGDTNIYKLEDGKKRLIPDAETFSSLGLDWNKVIQINKVEFLAYPAGSTLTIPEKLSEKPSAPTEEPIVFAVNKSYADKTSDWQGQVDQLFSRVNNIFAKNTSKRFRVGKYITFEDSYFYDIKTRPDKHPDFYQDFGGKGGITYFYIVTPDGLTISDIEKLYGLPAGHGSIGSATTEVSGGNVLYTIIWREETESHNIFSSGSPLYEQSKNLFIAATTHELGHDMGLAVPDIYLYQYSDCTGVDPKFDDYVLIQDPEFVNDPMASESAQFSISSLEFSPLNASIINKNLGRVLSFTTIEREWYSKVSKVRVVDNTGNPIQGATIKIYPVLVSQFYTNLKCENVTFGRGVPTNPQPEQILTTDSNGFATFNGPIGLFPSDNYMVKALKIYSGSKSAVTTVKFIDLQKNYVLNNSNDYLVEVRM